MIRLRSALRPTLPVARRGASPLWVWAILALAPAPGEAAQNLYEWLAVAPVVAAGTVEHDDGKFLAVRLDRVFRGEPEAGSLVRVDVRRANREREESKTALRLEEGTRQLWLLRREEDRRSEGPPLFEIVRGVEGTRDLPAEGEAPWIEAVERLVAVQALRDEFAAWKAFRGMLEETNPLLIETALDLFAKFRRSRPDLLPLLLPLFDHPRPALRERSARLLGQIAEDDRSGDALEASGALPVLYGAARRDPSAAVRAAATAAVGHVRARGSDEVLAEIAREDPEQAVRYEAERILFDRRREGAPQQVPIPSDAGVPE